MVVMIQEAGKCHRPNSLSRSCHHGHLPCKLAGREGGGGGEVAGGGEVGGGDRGGGG